MEFLAINTIVWMIYNLAYNNLCTLDCMCGSLNMFHLDDSSPSCVHFF